MKRISILLATLCILTSINAQNKITTTSLQGTNVDTVLKRYVEGEGVEISNGQFNGNTGNISASTIGTFNKNNTSFPFNKGIYLFTGQSESSYYDNTNTFTQKNLSDVPLGSTLMTGCALDFYFMAYADTFAFNYIFSSQEYTSYTCSSFNDVFAFFLEGWDPVTFTLSTKNVALIPGTITASNPSGIPVTINSVNGGCSGTNSCGNKPNCYNGTYSAYYTTSYNSAYPSNFGFNGSTTALAAQARILSCTDYKMHLAIANVGDQSLPSAVFLEEGSFYSPSVEIKNEYTNAMSEGDTLIQNCRDCDLTFTLPTPPLSANISVEVNVGGDAFLGQDFSMMLPNGTYLTNTNKSFVFAQDSIEQSLHMSILPDAQFSPNQVKTVYIYFKTELCPGNAKSVRYDTLTFYLRGNDSIKIKKENLVFGACDMLPKIEMELEKGNPASYQWIPTTGILQPDSLSPNTQITTSGTYKLIAVDQWNCMSDTAEIEVNIVDKPDFTVSYTPDHGCMPLDVTVQTQYTPNYATLKWTIYNDDDFEYEDDQALFHTSLPDSGYYSIKLVVESAPGCSDSTTLANVVHVSGFPTADFTFSPAEPGNGEEIQFFNASTGGNIVTWVWNFGDGHSSFVENPTHTYHLQESDIMTTKLTVTNSDGCSGDVFYMIPVEDNFALFVPSGFSPNTDGVNDVFMPMATDVANYKLEIYARNGELIFFTTNPAEGWDGQIKDKPAPEGVYIYKIQYARIGTPDQLLMKTGSITLVR